MFNNWFKKEKPVQGMMGFGGGAAGYLLRGGKSFIDSSITLVNYGSNTTTPYSFPAQWQNAGEITTVVFGGSGAGGNGAGGGFLHGGGGGGSGTANYNYPLPSPAANLDIVQNGLTFVYNATSTGDTFNEVKRTNDSSSLFKLANGKNGPGQSGAPATPAGYNANRSGAGGGSGGSREQSGNSGSSGSGVGGGGGGAFGRGNGGNSGPGASGGGSNSPYPSYPQWTVSGGSPSPGGNRSGEYGGAGGRGASLNVTSPGFSIPSPNNAFGAGGGGGGPNSGPGNREPTPGTPGFFVVYVEGKVLE